MPMLHRGGKAFKRLQLEIIKKSNDHSIFAWSLTPKGIFSASYLPNTRGLLSYSPAEFRHCERILISTEMVTKLYSITNLGLFIKLPIVDNIPSYKEASPYTILKRMPPHRNSSRETGWLQSLYSNLLSPRFHSSDRFKQQGIEETAS